MKNTIKALLIKLGVSSEDSIVPYYPRTRDREDVSVLKCRKSGVILLSRTDHMEISHYEELQLTDYWQASNRREAVLSKFHNYERRYEQFKDWVTNKKWLDVGVGNGAMLELFSPITKESVGVEPANQARHELVKEGYKVFKRVEDINDKDFEIVSLFHVLEHLTDPIEMLLTIHDRMIEGGKLIIETPHARDCLLEFIDLEAYKAHIFWSEHVMLHTRRSLEVFLQAAGFKNIFISGYQRYPLANHLYWLSVGEPGGHEKWSSLSTPELDRAYMAMLAKLDLNDTLIAVAEK